MIKLTAEIKAKMRLMAKVHAALAVFCALLLLVSAWLAREQAAGLFLALAALNIVGIAALAFYLRREKFP